MLHGTLPSNVLDLPQHLSHTIKGDHHLPDFDKQDWWTSFSIPPESTVEPGQDVTALPLDLGKQPNSAPSIEDEKDESLDDLLHSLKVIYSEFLYVSKAPLAFFAKNTLPKVRQRVVDRKWPLQEYKAWLLSTLVPALNELDRKYKEVIPQLVRSLSGSVRDKDTPVHESVEVSAMQQWATNCAEHVHLQSPESLLSKFLPLLKTREYQLLTLILLEAITLNQAANISSSVPDYSVRFPPSNAQEPSVLVDVLIDRLGIMQSLDFLRSEDPLQMFFLEVISPFYGTRVPSLVAELQLKCVSQDLLSFDIPGTPARNLKRKKESFRGLKKVESSVGQAAKLKRTRSAPANLLSEKRVVPKKRNLGREVAMTKRAPSFEIHASKPSNVKQTISFEEKRKLKVQREEEERVQVGQTPAKKRVYDSQTTQNNVPHIAIGKDSKASFMSVGDTPVKTGAPLENISETPAQAIKTPTRRGSRVLQAPVDGVHDTPTGRSILFKLDSPSVPWKSHGSRERPADDGDVGVVAAAATASPLASRKRPPATLKKSVTFSGPETRRPGSGNLFRHLIGDEDDGDNDDDEEEYRSVGRESLFGEVIVARRRSTSSMTGQPAAEKRDLREREEDVPSESVGTRAKSLEEALDWL